MKYSQGTGKILISMIVFGIVIYMVWMGPTPPEKPLRIARTLASSTANDINVLWLNQDISPLIATDGGEAAYALSLDRKSLFAFNIKSGTTMWKIDLPFELRGARGGLLANQTTVFVISGSRVNAYEKTDGKIKWSFKLGEGHVTVVSQLDADMLRIYYGDILFELDQKTGETLTLNSKDEVVWVIGNIELHASSANELSAFDILTKQRLWKSGRSFSVTERWHSEESKEGVLIVGYQDFSNFSLVGEICALNLQTGKNNWCHVENYISNIAVDQQLQLGYVLRDDFMLEIINLETGNIQGEIRFLPNSLSEEMLRFSHSYYVAQSDSIVIVSFGDSDQTFGLSLK